MDLTSSEQDQALDFLKKNAELKISLENLMGDKTSIKSSERKKIFSFFNKLISKKVVYGFLMAKTTKDNNFEGSIVPMDFKSNNDGKDSYVFANGSIKPLSTLVQAPLKQDETAPNEPIETQKTMVLTYHFSVAFSERTAAVSHANHLFKSIFQLI